MVSTKYGNIVEEGLETVWQRMSAWSDDAYVPETCKPCDLVERCKGACRAEAEREVGSLDSKHPYSIKPVHLEQQGGVYVEAFFPGERIQAARGIRARRESDDLTILYATGDRYLFADSNTARVVSGISKKREITITRELAENQVMRKILSQGIQSGILTRN